MFTTLVAIITTVYAFVNAFGAWMVIRRKRWLGLLFMAAAALLMVAAASFISPSEFSLPVLGLSLAFSSSLSVLNSYILLGQLRLRNNILRWLFALALFAFAMFSLIQAGIM